MGMNCDCIADIGSKVGVMWRERHGSGVKGSVFGEEKVGGLGCGKGVGWRVVSILVFNGRGGG